MRSNVEPLRFEVDFAKTRNSFRPTILLVVLLLPACGRSTVESPKSLSESSNGIEEADVAVDVRAESPESNEGEGDSLVVHSDVFPQEPYDTSNFEVTESAPDTSSSNPDIECPTFVPVDEPDFGKPTQPPSSYAPCTPDIPCINGEYCSAEFFGNVKGVELKGSCVRLCYHPKSGTQSELGCDSTQYCAVTFRCIQLSEDSECDLERGTNVEWKAWCIPKSRTKGGLGGNWDYSQCPCDNPASGMTPDEKATCEEAWADMQNQ